jgi:hypothetical protein
VKHTKSWQTGAGEGLPTLLLARVSAGIVIHLASATLSQVHLLNIFQALYTIFGHLITNEKAVAASLSYFSDCSGSVSNILSARIVMNESSSYGSVMIRPVVSLIFRAVVP